MMNRQNALAGSPGSRRAKGVWDHRSHDRRPACPWHAVWLAHSHAERWRSCPTSQRVSKRGPR